jgi:thiamine-phosphate pyrophosphorylase
VPAFAFPSRLYPIVDTLADPQRSAVELAEAMLAAGARLLQLRVKGEPTNRFVELARAIQARAGARSAALIINDRSDVAALVGAAGVHLGQDDLPARDARRLLGAEKFIGVSTHNPAQVDAVEREGVADYVGFGPIYPTSSKPNPDPVQGTAGLRRARARSRLPLVAIGGITLATAGEVIRAGADAVAVIGDLTHAADPAARVRQYLEQLV